MKFDLNALYDKDVGKMTAEELIYVERRHQDLMRRIEIYVQARLDDGAYK